MKQVELLAPAKDYETAIAAINSGADAIYIGANCFGARHNASNSIEIIEKVVRYAHKFYVRVHVTINTILNNKELLEAKELVKTLYNIGVDAIIVQDMGLINLAIKGELPPIQIHASTQCNNRTLDKVKFFDNMGISRVILARELSLDKIDEICNNTNCEIETFIHGALCVSYSGQCYLSYANGGRSANRGECAQPCRKKYTLLDEYGKVILADKYLLSLKDFNASKHIKSLIDSGVKSFKIEGRLKDINYVKNVVSHYNTLLNQYARRTSSGKVFLDFEPNVEKTFNRTYTDYFLSERTQCFNFLSPKSRGEKLGAVKSFNKSYFTIDAALNPQDGVCYIENGEMKGFLVNKVVGDKIYPNKSLVLKKGTILYRNFDTEFEKKLNNSKISRKIGVKMVINNGKLFAQDEDNNRVSIDLPLGDIPNNLEKLKQNLILQLSKSGDSDYYVISVCLEDDDLPFLPISKINDLRRELLKLLDEERLQNYNRLPQNPIKYCDYIETEVDYKANILNDEAEDFYKKSSCKVEQRAIESETLIKSRVELMRTKHCLKFASGLCGKSCPKLYLLDKASGKNYPLIFDCKNCEMAILNP